MQGYPLIPRELSSVTGDRSPLIPIIPILGKQMLKLPCLLRLRCSLDVYSSNVLALFVVLSPILDVEGSISWSICLQQRSDYSDWRPRFVHCIKLCNFTSLSPLGLMMELCTLLLVSLLFVFAMGQLPSQDIVALLEFKKGIKHDPAGYVLNSLEWGVYRFQWVPFPLEWRCW